MSAGTLRVFLCAAFVACVASRALTEADLSSILSPLEEKALQLQKTLDVVSRGKAQQAGKSDEGEWQSMVPQPLSVVEYNGGVDILKNAVKNIAAVFEKMKTDVEATQTSSDEEIQKKLPDLLMESSDLNEDGMNIYKVLYAAFFRILAVGMAGETHGCSSLKTHALAVFNKETPIDEQTFLSALTNDMGCIHDKILALKEDLNRFENLKPDVVMTEALSNQLYLEVAQTLKHVAEIHREGAWVFGLTKAMRHHFDASSGGENSGGASGPSGASGPAVEGGEEERALTMKLRDVLEKMLKMKTQK